MRKKAFSVRIFKEIIRDPLSYIFCLGFPLIMLVVMTLINDSIPQETGMTIFRIDDLAGAIAVFGLTFIMLFVCLTAAKDRLGAFLVRLYATPMRSGDFIVGYTLPAFLLAALQTVITFAVSEAVSLFTKVELHLGGLALAAVSLFPTMIMFISLGLLSGTLFSEKAAPGLCSVIISLSSFLGGVWFDADRTGGVLLKISKALPFYHSVKVARLASALEFEGFGKHFLITVVWAAAFTTAAVFVFKVKMRADIK